MELLDHTESCSYLVGHDLFQQVNEFIFDRDYLCLPVILQFDAFEIFIASCLFVLKTKLENQT